jgi:3'-phosphoadenosine 5'-phosphosulfate sulfotransferase (PAPS reductase)/FAD synthetase
MKLDLVPKISSGEDVLLHILKNGCNSVSCNGKSEYRINCVACPLCSKNGHGCGIAYFGNKEVQKETRVKAIVKKLMECGKTHFIEDLE